MRPFGPSTNVGVDDDSGRFFGAMALASAPMSWKPFGTPGFTEKSSIWLFSRMPVPGTMSPEPKKKLSVMVAATMLPFCVDDREMRGGRPGRRCVHAWQHGARRRAVHADRRALAGRVVLVDEARDRHVDEIRIAEIHGAVAMHAAHGLDDEMRARDLVELGEIETVEDVERIDQRDAARGGRRTGDDARAAIVADHGRTLHDLVVGEVGFGPVAAELRNARPRASSRTRPCRNRQRPWRRATRRWRRAPAV